MTVEAFIAEIEGVLGDRLTEAEVAFVRDSLADGIMPALDPEVDAIRATAARQVRATPTA